MEYRTALFFLFLYYIRPQDWVPAISGVNIIRPMILIWLVSFLGARTRPAVSGLMRTPHDWAMLAYGGYIVWNAPSMSDAFKGILPFMLFYTLTVQSLTSWDRMLGYLKAWNLVLLGVAGIAVASLYGLDLTGAVDMTAKNIGRLCLGTWMHNNPNSLAHSVIVILPLSFVLYCWKQGVLSRMVLFPACCILAGYCAYETESKGSFLVGGILSALIFVVGRPKPVQILVLVATATVGVSALSFLPRMEQMGNLRADAGVQGRLMVWEMARYSVDTKPTGDGWKQFQGYIIWDGKREDKATHSSYVQIGGDLGIYGLFFYLLLLWLALRTLLMSARLSKEDPIKERCRRGIMLLIIAYMISGWMINREYHTEYFLVLAAAAAMHRLMLAEEMAMQIEMKEVGTSPSQPVLNTWYEAGKRLRNRISVVDVGVGVAMTWAVMFTWDYILKNL
jgi:hypothetical protein